MSQAAEHLHHSKDMAGAIFVPEFCHDSAHDLLSYFQGRSTVQYFPVIDEIETERNKINRMAWQREFEFNHETHVLPSPILWMDNPSQDLEWLILLHKFYYAVGLGKAFDETKNSRYLQIWQELTLSWIDEVSMDFLPSDVMGRRIQNWIFAHYYFVTQNPTADVSPDFYKKFLRSLQEQVSYLSQHLTPGRNHRTLELCAIFLAAVVFPEFSESAQWLEMSKGELVKNIQTDLLPDGVHFEQSTDYHHLVLKNYLWVRRLAHFNDIAVPAVMDNRIQKALQFALYAHKPDGLIPSISDGDSRSFLELLAQGYEVYGDEEMRYVFTRGTSGMAPAERSKGFPEGGYYILRSGWGDSGEPYEDERYLFFDCGPLGAGNHGHFDLLNIEIAAYGRSLIVDPGRYTYDETGETNWRVRFRSTAYHNTVLIDGQNQTRYLPDKKRYKIKGPEPDYEIREFVSQAGFDYVHGIAQSHEYPVRHERKILFVSGQYWIIVDLLIANEPHSYDLLFHLSDEAYGKTSVTCDETNLRVHAPHLVLTQPHHPDIRHSIEDGYVSRTYGKKILAPIVKLSSNTSSLCYHTVVFPYRDQCPDVRVEALPVKRNGLTCNSEEASAIGITISDHGQTNLDYLFVKHGLNVGECSFGQFSQDGDMCFLRTDSGGRILLHYLV